MRLLKVKLSGIRRFEETDALLVADRLVAIVGPNEAGKTSLLEALDQVGRIDEPLPNSIATRQSTTSPTIRALFELDEFDRRALSDIHDASEVVRCWVIRTTSGTRWQLEKSPKRNLEARQDLLEILRAIEEDPTIRAALDSDAHPLTSALWDAATSLAASDADSLKDEERSAFISLADALATVSEPTPEEAGEAETEEDEAREKDRARRQEARHRAVQALRAVAASEKDPSPRLQALRVIRERLPTIVKFRDEDRNLQSEYDLQELGAEIPPALSNVAALAEMSIGDLRVAIESGDHGTVRLLREAANQTLKDFFDRSYGQSDVCLQFDTDGFLLRLLVRAEGGEDFVELSDRSAGFQWFVALVAFLAQRRYERPLVLIDEIDTHLHYGAQADVIDVLSRQTIAQQVIYTTHSAGALPPDLGRGVRAVVPVEGRQRSAISNSFWTSGPGYTPLLFGLGAATLAFSIPRFVVIAEGASDAILLPTLLREAAGLEELPYRIAPGISNTPPEALRSLDQEGGRVVYLVDADEAGRTHQAHLIEAGIEAARILSVPDEAATPEDFVKSAIYLDAVNREGEPFWGEQAISSEDLPAIGRAKAVQDWCKARSLPAPSKIRVAQNVIEGSWEPLEALDDEDSLEPAVSGILLTEITSAYLRSLHASLVGALDLNAGPKISEA